MKINENILKSLSKNKNEDEITSVYLNNKSISKFVFKYKVYKNIQILSLESNNLSDIEFLSAFPFLWCLNIKKNPVRFILIQIGNYSALKSVNTLGYLGITLDSFSFNSFVSLRKLNIGILEINENYTYENLYLNPTQHNQNVNESYLQNNLKCQSEINNKVNASIIPNILLLNNRIIYASQIFDYAIDEGLSIKFYCSTITNSNLEIRDDFNLFLEEWHREFKIIQNNYSKEKKTNLFDDLIYKKIERLKSMFIFKIYESMAFLNHNTNNIISFELDGMYKFNPFNKNILKSEDKFYQKFILIILLFFILKIISFKLTIKLTKHIVKAGLKIKIKSKELAKIFSIDSIYLIGLYYELLDHFKFHSKVRNFSQDNLIFKVFNNYNDSIQILDISFSHLFNKIKENEGNIIGIYKDGIEFKLRKKIIFQHILKFFHKELNFLEKSLILIQYLYDFIIYTKIIDSLTKKLPLDYRIFLEIRGCFFQYLDKQNFKEEMFDNLADRKFFDFRNSNRANTMSLNTILQVENKNEKKSSNLIQIVKSEKVLKIEENKTKISKKKLLEDNLEIKRLNIDNPEDLFVTGFKSRNFSNEDRIFSRTFNKFPMNKLKITEDIKIKTVNAEVNTRNLQDNVKFNHREASLILYNKFILDEDYLRNMCRELLKNNKKFSSPKEKIEEIGSRFSKTTGNFYSIGKKLKFKSTNHIDFYKTNLLKDIKIGLFDDQRKKGETHLNLNLKLNNAIKNQKLYREKKLDIINNKQNLIAKGEMKKIEKFKEDFILHRLFSCDNNKKSCNHSQSTRNNEDNYLKRSSHLHKNSNKKNVVSVNNILYNETINQKPEIRTMSIMELNNLIQIQNH